MENNNENGIEKIHNAIVKYVLEFLKTGIFRNKTTNAYMTAYQTVLLFSDDEGDSSKELYEYFIKTIRDYINDALKSIEGLDGEAFVDTFLKENKQIKILIYWMRKIFGYLDKFYMKNLEKGSLQANALHLYNKEMFTPLQSKLFQVTISMMRDDRLNKVVDREKIKQLIKVFEEIDLDEAELIKQGDNLNWRGHENLRKASEFVEAYLIPETDSFTKEKTNNEINSLAVPEYVLSSLKYLDEEEERIISILNKNFHKKIEKVNMENFITSKVKDLAKKDTGIVFMLKNKKKKELKDIYQLISKDPNSLSCITGELDPHVREKGEELSKNPAISKDPKLLIPELIKLKLEIDDLVEFSFDRAIMFQTCKKNAFSGFLNKVIFQKQIANYCDWELRAGIKGNSDTQIEQKFNDINNIFKCMLSKEVFIMEYSKRLGDRLLQNKTQSIIQEKNLISRMKNEFGISNVSKITRKIEDLETSRTEMDFYRKEPHRAKPNGIEVNMQILDDSSWEIDKIKFQKFEKICSKISECLDSYTDFYIKRHSNNKIRYVYGQTTVEVQIQKLNKPYLLNCNLMQLTILQILEEKGPLTCKILSDYLSFDLKQTIHDITFLWAHPSFNLKRLPNLGLIIPENLGTQKELSEGITMKINPNFNHNSIRISSIPTSAPKKSKEEEEKEERDEALNRKKFHNQVTDATIVRIMKGRIGQKTSHGFLVTETSRQIDLFTAQPMQIKERIEHLMQDQFIKRCEDDRNCYEYIA